MKEYQIEVLRTGRFYVLGGDGGGERDSDVKVAGGAEAGGLETGGVEGGADGGVSEVWAVLHGYGYLARRFLRWFRPLDDGRRLVVAPEGLSRFYYDGARGHVGASWMTKEDREAEIDDYIRYLDAVYDAVTRDGNLRSVPLVVLGFSQGAATAARWACMGSAAPSRLILWGGSVPPDLDLDEHRNRLNAMRLQLVLGDHDEYADPDAVAAERTRLREHGIHYEPVSYAGRHEVDARVLRDLTGGGLTG